MNGSIASAIAADIQTTNTRDSSTSVPAVPAPTQTTVDANTFVGNTLLTTNNPTTIASTPQNPPKQQKLPSVVSLSGNCALYAKSVTGIVTGAPVASQTISYAKKAGYETSKDTPEVGGIMQTKEGPVGHVAVITKIEDGKVLTSERNYPVKSRWVSIDDPIVVGFVYPKTKK